MSAREKTLSGHNTPLAEDELFAFVIKHEHIIEAQRSPWQTTAGFGWVIWASSSGRGHHKGPNMHTVESGLWKGLRLQHWPIMEEENTVNQACGCTQTRQSHRCSRTNTPRSRWVDFITPVWTGCVWAVTFIEILQENPLTICQRSRQDLSLCIHCVILQDLVDDSLEQH